MLLSAWLSKLIINRFCHYRTWGIVFARAEHAAGLLACRRLSLLLGASGPPAGLWTAAVFYPAPWRLPRPQSSGLLLGAWTARRALLRPLYCLLVGRDSSLYYLRPNPLRFWTAAGFWPAPWRLARPQGLWNRALGPCVLFVGRRYYLRPPSAPPLERAKRIWNSRRLLERRRLLACSLALLERRIAATRVRVCGDNAMNVR